MSKGRRKYSQEFKREAVALVLEHGYSCEAAGRSLGVRGALVGRWKREIEAKALEVAKEMEALCPAQYAEPKRRNDGTFWTDAVAAAWEAVVKISEPGVRGRREGR